MAHSPFSVEKETFKAMKILTLGEPVPSVYKHPVKMKNRDFI